jgi:hypothetical protein
MYDRGWQDFDGSFSRASLTNFERNELSDQIFEFSRQGLHQGWQMLGMVLATNGTQ